MDYKAIINLMKEMNNTELTKLEVETEGVRICLEKASAREEAVLTQVAPQYIMPSQLPQMNFALNQPMSSANTPAPTALASQADKAEQSVSEATSTKQLVSPMVGTFYAQPSPDKPPYLKVGDRVKKGQTICIIEAMKLLNEIESEFDGEVVEMLVKNEEMVEFGQPLFLIR